MDIRRGASKIRPFLLAVAILLFAASGVCLGQDPVIIVPGLTGSELVNSKTGEVVWFKAPRSKDDDLRLPVSTDLVHNRDNLIPGDILRSVKFGIFPRIDVYGGLIDALETQGGYHEESWDKPTDKAAEASIFVFAYDWRLDNVFNARLLIRKIEDLKKRLKRPDLKFDIIAHSMGGIVARYAAMYGDVDLPAGGRTPHPTWAGAKLFNKVVLLGTPNEGSILALNSMVNGFAIGGININLPWIQNISRFDLFTIPSGYQLLPAPDTLRIVDENFEPMDIDIYDPKEWTKYGWNAIDDPRFADEFKLSERKIAPVYFKEMLERGKRLHEALDAPSSSNDGVSIYLVGGDCKDTPDTAVLYRDSKKGGWKTIFKPASFEKETGGKVTAEDLKPVMLAPGDGIVTRRSFEMETLSHLKKVDSLLRPTETKFSCEEHNRLAASPDVQVYLIKLLTGK